jgi:hypothetical protein
MNSILLLIQVLCILMALTAFPMSSATPSTSPFTIISFSVFSDFIENQFSSKISLAMVLTILFTMTENVDLLNLHARQQNPRQLGEMKQTVTGWMKALSRIVQQELSDQSHTLFQKSEDHPHLSSEAVTNNIARKLDAMSKMLGLYPYDKSGRFRNKLQVIAPIQPIYVVCPERAECEKEGCSRRSLLQANRDRDMPHITLIKNSQIHDRAYVLSGQCPKCKTRYFADHHSIEPDAGQDDAERLYLNLAKYLKVGQALWVDRLFARAVLNGTYSFHASVSAYAEFWNNSFWAAQDTNSRKISRRQIWHTFVQESLCLVATASNTSLILPDGSDIKSVTHHAFETLGQNGIIAPGQAHGCSECTHPYKATTDVITGDDPAALLGQDENRAVPALVGEDAHRALQDAAQPQQHVHQQGAAMDQDDPDTIPLPVQLVVMDGIVMGHTVSLIN